MINLIQKKHNKFLNRVKEYLVGYVRLNTNAVSLKSINDITTHTSISSIEQLFTKQGKSVSMYLNNAKSFVDKLTELDEFLIS